MEDAVALTQQLHASGISFSLQRIGIEESQHNTLSFNFDGGNSVHMTVQPAKKEFADILAGMWEEHSAWRLSNNGRCLCDVESIDSDSDCDSGGGAITSLRLVNTRIEPIYARLAEYFYQNEEFFHLILVRTAIGKQTGPLFSWADLYRSVAELECVAESAITAMFDSPFTNACTLQNDNNRMDVDVTFSNNDSGIRTCNIFVDDAFGVMKRLAMSTTDGLQFVLKTLNDFEFKWPCRITYYLRAAFRCTPTGMDPFRDIVSAACCE